MSGGATELERTGQGHTAAIWFGRSGFANDVEAFGTPWQYARHLVRYIADPSTVRARVADRFGRRGLIPVDAIAQVRAEFLAQRDAATAKHGASEPEPGDHAVFAGPRADPPLLNVRLRAEAPPEYAMPALGTPGFGLTGRDFIDLVARAHGFSGEQICAGGRRSRRAELARVRNLIRALLLTRGNTRAGIGRMTGNDHATTIHGIERFFVRDRHDADLRASWEHYAPEWARGAESYAELSALLRERKGCDA